MKIRLVGLGLVFCSLLSAQDAPKVERVTKIVKVHGNAQMLANLARAGRAEGVVEGNPLLGAVVIHAFPAEAADIEQTIHELDGIADPAAGKNVELVAYLVQGSMEAMESGMDVLSPVYKQLHSIFPYKGYQLLSTMLLRSGQRSEASSSGMLKPLPTNPSTIGSYHLSYDQTSISSDSPPSIHLNRLQFTAKIPVTAGGTNYQMVDIGIYTNADLREGQKIVVGTSNVEPSGTTLFLVVTARLL